MQGKRQILWQGDKLLIHVHSIYVNYANVLVNFLHSY